MWRKPRGPEFSDTDKDLFAKASKRVQGMATTRMLDYADAVVIAMGDNVDDFRKQGDLSSLADMGLGLITLWAIVTELKAKREAELDKST